MATALIGKSGPVRKTVTITANQTFFLPDGYDADNPLVVDVLAIGGGGGGGGGSVASSWAKIWTTYGGGGGSGVAVAKKLYLSEPVEIVVGAGGLGGSPSYTQFATEGGDGGDTFFGTFIAAPGGEGARPAGQGGSGGSGGGAGGPEFANSGSTTSSGPGGGGVFGNDGEPSLGNLTTTSTSYVSSTFWYRYQYWDWSPPRPGMVGIMGGPIRWGIRPVRYSYPVTTSTTETVESRGGDGVGFNPDQPGGGGGATGTRNVPKAGGPGYRLSGGMSGLTEPGSQDATDFGCGGGGGAPSTSASNDISRGGDGYQGVVIVSWFE